LTEYGTLCYTGIHSQVINQQQQERKKNVRETDSKNRYLQNDPEQENTEGGKGATKNLP